jgi:protein-tyrosine phosphatase
MVLTLSFCASVSQRICKQDINVRLLGSKQRADIASKQFAFSSYRVRPGSVSWQKSRPLLMVGECRPAGVLMVCLGNICRSPAAEAVLRATISRRGLDSAVTVDSCGTGGDSPNWYKPGGFSYHEGDPADARMRRAGANRDYDITSLSRPLRSADFETFDLILGMDAKNLTAIETARNAWGVGKPGTAGIARVALFSSYSSNEQFHGRAVPDPYYGGQEGFEHVLDLIEETCEGILSDPVIAAKIDALCIE